jgi:hypothetical protein
VGVLLIGRKTPVRRRRPMKFEKEWRGLARAFRLPLAKDGTPPPEMLDALAWCCRAVSEVAAVPAEPGEPALHVRRAAAVVGTRDVARALVRLLRARDVVPRLGICALTCGVGVGGVLLIGRETGADAAAAAGGQRSVRRPRGRAQSA